MIDCTIYPVRFFSAFHFSYDIRCSIGTFKYFKLSIEIGNPENYLNVFVTLLAKLNNNYYYK